MRKRLVAAALVAGATNIIQQADAAPMPLTGELVTLSVQAGPEDYGTQTVLVGPGDDASIAQNQIRFDFDAGTGYTFTISSVAPFGSISGVPGSKVTVSLSNLDFGDPLMGLFITKKPNAVTINSLTATSVSFSYTDTFIPQGVFFSADFSTTSAGSVPLPSSAPLLGGALLALAGVGYAHRQLKVKVA